MQKPGCLAKRIVYSHAIVFSMLALCAASGCKDEPKLAAVEGRVLLDGKPLTGAQIEFQPERGSPSYGETDAAGRYRLRFTRHLEGALPGKHVVRVRTAKHLSDGEGRQRLIPEFLPPKYHDASELVYNIEPGDNQIEIELQSAPGAAR